MRTKTLLLTAAIMAAGLGASMAQVYSVNAVGYVNKTVGNGYSLIANPLNGTNNMLSTVLPIVPDGAVVLKWNPAGQTFADSIAYIEGIGWIPDSEVKPGDGFFFSNPGAQTTLTFVGEVPQGTTLTNTLWPNYSLISSIVPQSFALDAVGVNFPSGDGDVVLTWNSAGQTFNDSYSYIDGIGWIPNAPVIGVGEGFFYSNAGAARTWTRSFSVN